MAIRGFNADPEVVLILQDLDIPKMQFSKQLNKIVKEWHTTKKQAEYDKANPRPQVRLIG